MVLEAVALRGLCRLPRRDPVSYLRVSRSPRRDIFPGNDPKIRPEIVLRMGRRLESPSAPLSRNEDVIKYRIISGAGSAVIATASGAGVEADADGAIRFKS